MLCEVGASGVGQLYLNGLREVPEITGNGRLHIAHVNSYCRGFVLDNVTECREALDIIASKRGQFVTEAYLARGKGQSHRNFVKECHKLVNRITNNLSRDFLDVAK